MRETGKIDDVVDCPECGVQNTPCTKCKKVKPSCPTCLSKEENGHCKKHKSSFYTNFGIPALFALLILFITILYAIWAKNFKGEDWKDSAHFGDSFGGLNALFSGLAFAGLIYTIHLQRKELSLQRLELSETRKELKKSAKAQRDSSEHQEKLAKLEAYSALLAKTAELKSANQAEYRQMELLLSKTTLTSTTVKGDGPSGYVTIPDITEIKKILVTDEKGQFIQNLDNAYYHDLEDLDSKIQGILSELEKTRNAEASEFVR